jgi:two-component system NtrC family sensor kinase
LACSWRIRHKLILGMSMVAAVMALLLGGTLYGLASYRAAMSTCVRKIDEIDLAQNVKGEISKLRDQGPEPSLQANHIQNQIPEVEKALDGYALKLQETVNSGRAPNEGKEEQLLVAILKEDIKTLQKELKKETDKTQVNVGMGRTSWLNARPAIRDNIDNAEHHVNDLISFITGVIGKSTSIAREDARKSIILLITTGIMAVLLMAGLLRFFYRWVARPIRELEDGVRKVALGNFQHHIEIHSGDEIEDLAKSYNEMTDKLRAMYENLAQQVNERSRQLVRSERLAGVGFLAAGVAHEINNPLAAILFSSEALESRLAELLLRLPMASQDREVIAKYLKMIQEEAFRCKEITQKLLAFSRGGERKREETDLTTVVQGVLDVVQHLQSFKGKRIDFRPAGPMVAWVNGQEVKQVFLNLVINALESMEEGGVLTIAQQMHDGQIEMAFKDTGCGMTPDILENIFEPFFTRSRTGKGTGLGLSISHRVITQHGGEIEAGSDGAGKGSTFKVRLPIQPPPNAAEQGQDVQDPVEEFLKLSAAQHSARAA